MAIVMLKVDKGHTNWSTDKISVLDQSPTDGSATILVQKRGGSCTKVGERDRRRRREGEEKGSKGGWRENGAQITALRQRVAHSETSVLAEARVAVLRKGEGATLAQ